MRQFPEIALAVPKILLPHNVDLTKWAVVACDQYTSQPEYWEMVKNTVGSSPSTYKIVLPEIYLEEKEVSSRISKINQEMKNYLQQNIFKEEEGFILVDRKTSHVKSRKGLMVALDLEKYDFSKGSQSLIRATEGTVVERLPPRIKIRENAPVELPHIMVLIDDPHKTVIEPLFELNLPKVYDFELMMNGGHIKGWKISDEATIKSIVHALSELGNKATFQSKYPGKEVLLYAMGDGNHSLATAKSIWEQLKQKAGNKDKIMEHPARWALIELVNVHDPGIIFEPIHRVLFNVNITEMLKEMKEFFSSQGSEFSYQFYKNKKELEEDRKRSSGKAHLINFVYEQGIGLLTIKEPRSNLEVGTLQNFIDFYLKKHQDMKVDYIHGDEVVNTLGSKPGNIGFFLPAMPKKEFFRTVILDGVLPRKTFSMGEAEEKRYYLEARKIVL